MPSLGFELIPYVMMHVDSSLALDSSLPETNISVQLPTTDKRHWSKSEV